VRNLSRVWRDKRLFLIVSQSREARRAMRRVFLYSKGMNKTRKEILGILRHVVAVFFVAAGLMICSSVLSVGGVLHLAWAAAITNSIDAGFVAVATVVPTLWLLPAYRRLGLTGSPVTAKTLDETPDGLRTFPCKD